MKSKKYLVNNYIKGKVNRMFDTAVIETISNNKHILQFQKVGRMEERFLQSYNLREYKQ